MVSVIFLIAIIFQSALGIPKNGNRGSTVNKQDPQPVGSYLKCPDWSLPLLGTNGQPKACTPGYGAGQASCPSGYRCIVNMCCLEGLGTSTGTIKPIQTVDTEAPPPPPLGPVTPPSESVDVPVGTPVPPPGMPPVPLPQPQPPSQGLPSMPSPPEMPLPVPPPQVPPPMGPPAPPKRPRPPPPTIPPTTSTVPIPIDNPSSENPPPESINPNPETPNQPSQYPEVPSPNYPSEGFPSAPAPSPPQKHRGGVNEGKSKPRVLPRVIPSGDSMHSIQETSNSNTDPSTFGKNIGTHIATSGRFKSCSTNDDCNSLREPQEWCQLGQQFVWTGIGCHCANDGRLQSCIIERYDLMMKTTHWTYCGPKNGFKCE